MTACPHCGAQNKASDKFCTECGTPLSATPQDSLDLGIVCPHCDTYNDSNIRTCIRCGLSLSGLTSVLESFSAKKDQQRAVTPPATSKSTNKSELGIDPPSPTQEKPTEVVRPGPKPTAVPSDFGFERCPFCQAQLMASIQFCMACGQALETEHDGQTPLETQVTFHLRLLQGNGPKGATYALETKECTVGRGPGTITIENDLYLSPCHFRLRHSGQALEIEDQNSFNGTFLRIQHKRELRQGDEFIVGQERILIVGFGGPTTDNRMVGEFEARPYGGPIPKNLFVAFRTLHPHADANILRSPILLRQGPIITIGQKNCDLNFQHDQQLANAGIELQVQSTGLQLVVQKSFKEVFLKIRDRTMVQAGDEILAGQEIFKVEIGQPAFLPQSR